MEIIKNAEDEEWQAEIHIRFSNNVSAIDEDQIRDSVGEDPDYMKGVNERNLDKISSAEGRRYTSE